METTFISIHDLSLDARLLYVSTSIVDILGWMPGEVVGKSCWEYFHPDEIPFARAIHGRGVQLDKAAVLNYCQIKNRDGRWVGCECVFTIVHDVLVASTSIYRSGVKSQKRRTEAPIIRQLFSSSPRDPRYHMLSYISQKFQQDLKPLPHEPRAALFLNRFTRTLTVMYATNGLADVLGISAEALTGKSFYYCIQENCLREAVRCLESAKANDSIAYLRFWFRDPRQDDQMVTEDQTENGHSSGDEDDGGVHLDDGMVEGPNEVAVASDSSMSRTTSAEQGPSGDHLASQRSSSLHVTHPFNPNSRTSSGDSMDSNANSTDAMFDPPITARSSSSSLSFETMEGERQHEARGPNMRPPEIELEAVVSCTSDGLVVILRKAKPFVPPVEQLTAEAIAHPYANGFFASPWATDPILPNPQQQPQYGMPNGFQTNQTPIHPTAVQATTTSQGPPAEMFMNTIREVAVFAWSLTGINGSLAQYGHGKPSGEALPPGGLPIWEPDSNAGPEIQRLNCIANVLNPSNGYQTPSYGPDGHTHIDAYGHTVGNSGPQYQHSPGFPRSNVYPGQQNQYHHAHGQ